MAEFQPKTEYGIRAEEYPFHGAKLHGHNSYGALEFNLAAEYPIIERAKKEKKKRHTLPHMAAAAMAAATVVLTAAAAPQLFQAPTERAAYTAPAETPAPSGPMAPEPTLPPPTKEATVPAAHIHSYTAETVREASCTEAGEIRYVCDCGDEYTEPIPTTEHTPEVIPGEEATCQAPGLTEGERCSVCGEILTPQEEIPQLEHTLEKKWGAYPTCTAPGYTSEIYCTVCGEVIHESVSIPATNHANAIPYLAVGSSCTVRGHTESVYCPDCDTWLVPRQELPMTNHVWGKEAVWDDVAQEPFFVCKICGAKKSAWFETEPAPGG